MDRPDDLAPRTEAPQRLERRPPAAKARRQPKKRNAARPDKTGVGRGWGIVDRTRDPKFRDAMTAIDAMQRRKGR